MELAGNGSKLPPHYRIIQKQGKSEIKMSSLYSNFTNQAKQQNCNQFQSLLCFKYKLRFPKFLMNEGLKLTL